LETGVPASFTARSGNSRGSGSLRLPYISLPAALTYG